MSVPPELMQLMGGGGGPKPPPAGAAPGGQPGMPPAPGGTGAPAGAAGMATPQKKAGEEAAAKTNIQIAMNMLEQALPVFGSESEEGKIILKSLTALGGKFGNDGGERELVPAQIMQLMKSEPSLGGGAMQKAMQPGQAPQPGAQHG